MPRPRYQPWAEKSLFPQICRRREQSSPAEGFPSPAPTLLSYVSQSYVGKPATSRSGGTCDCRSTLSSRLGQYLTHHRTPTDANAQSAPPPLVNRVSFVPEENPRRRSARRGASVTSVRSSKSSSSTFTLTKPTSAKRGRLLKTRALDGWARPAPRIFLFRQTKQSRTVKRRPG